MLVCQLFMIRSFAAEAVAFSLDFGKLTAGNDLEITCSVNKAPHIGGFVMKMTFDKDVFRYVENSYSAKQSKLKDADLNYNAKNGCLTVIWETQANKGLTTAGKLFSVKIKASTVLNSSEYEFGFKVTECYTDEAVPKNIRISSNGGKAVPSTEQKVQELIDKINSISPVTYSDECLAKIAVCEQLYKELTASERRQVTNYQDLLNFRAEYNKLAKQALEDSEKAAAEAYRTKYSSVLNKTVDQLVLSDKEDVEAAIAAWEALPTNAQKALLINEKNHLNKLKKRIDELVKADEDGKKQEEMERELREEAMRYKEAFDAKWEQILSLTPDTVTFDYAEVLSIASSEADTYCKMNSYCNEYLKDEMNLISSLINAIGGGESEDTSGISLSTFLKNYGYLSALKESDVTLSDAQDIKLAYQFLQMLSPESLSKVEKLSNHISLLFKAVEALEKSGADSDGDSFKDRLPDTSLEDISNTITIPGGSIYNIQTKNGDIRYASSGLYSSHSLLTLSILTLVSLTVFGAALAIFLISAKKRTKEVSL